MHDDFAGLGGLLGGAEARRSALAGVIVADFSRVLAGPLATMLLGDLGATILKIERPDKGDDTRAWGPPFVGGTSTYFLALNRNKRSVTLDLTDPVDRDRARAIVRRADVLVENFRPTTMDKLELGYEAMSKLNPRLIYCSISGFGTGEGASLPGYDSLVQAVGGLMSITGEPHGHPTRVGVALVDVITALFATVGILAAVHHRERSGAGQRVEVNLLSSLLMALVNQASAYLNTGHEPTRVGNTHPSVSPHDVFYTKDDPIFIIVGNDRQFEALCYGVGLPNLVRDDRFSSNAARVRNRIALSNVLAKVVGSEPASHWLAQFEARGVPSGPINSIGDAFMLAEKLGLKPIVELPATDGNCLRHVANPLILSQSPTSYGIAPPQLGADTALIEKWLNETSPDSHSASDPPRPSRAVAPAAVSGQRTGEGRFGAPESVVQDPSYGA
jgi:crotonobetainyl-CoA:carnitine CoA-transferase CaiB-like acyl-CoA transferase